MHSSYSFGREIDNLNVAWSKLVYDFTQDSTLHGIRYVTGPSRFIIRRLAWVIFILAAFGGFVWINIVNLQFYYSHPKSVNMEVTFEPELMFPAVTICNYNSFRFTKLVELGLYDQFYSYYTTESTEDVYTVGVKGCASTFTYLEGLCIENESERLALLGNQSKAISISYKGISELACETMCSQIHDLECSGIFYNRTSYHCEVTSAVLTIRDVTYHTTCDLNSLEYYRRERCATIPSVRCKFELELVGDFGNQNCPLSNSTLVEDDEEWIPVMAGSNDPPTDFDLDSERGVYMYMLATDKRSTYSATMNFPFLNFEHSCLEFYYYVVGTGKFTIKISLMSEQLITETVRSLKSTATAQWTRFFTRLPDGMHMLRISGVRPSEQIVSALAIDSINILNCDIFYADCKRTTSGREYMGNANVTSTGSTCGPWAGTVYENASFADGTAEDAGARCRNPVIVTQLTVPSQPWCMVDSTKEENCIIPFCECDADFFRCASGRCIPSAYTCDGFNDCGDSSDETDSERCLTRNVNCEFSTDYACGYTNLDATGLFFTRKKAYEVDDGLGPNVDVWGSSLGSFMFVDSRDGVEGDIAVLGSPVTTVLNGQCLSFYIYYVQSPSSTFNRFAIFQRTEGVLNAIHPYSFQIDTWNQTGWQQLILQLPKGAFKIFFEYVMGFPHEGDIAIDEVSVVSCSDFSDDQILPTTDQRLPETTNVSCTFDGGDWCGMDYFTDNHLGRWTLMPKIYLPNLVNRLEPDDCTNHYYTLTGVFDSPGYPSTYQSGYSGCVAHILAPPGAHITLTLLRFDLEGSTNCTFDRVEIRAGVKNSAPLSVLCDVTPEGMVIEIADHKAWVFLYTDASVQAMGFRIMYELSTLPDVDYIPMLYYEGQMSGILYSATLHTEVIDLQSISCLKFNFLSISAFEVHLLGQDDIKIFATDNWVKPKTWNHLSLNLPRGYYQLAFISDFVGEGRGWRSMIDDVTVRTGICDEIYTVGTVECDFSEVHQCGYMDVSVEPQRWLRYVEKASGQFVVAGVAPNQMMHVGLSAFQVNTKTLMSPPIDVTDATCLTFAFYPIHAGLLLRLMSHKIINGTDYVGMIGHTYPPHGRWTTVVAQLPVGSTYRLLFTVSGMNNNAFLANVTTSTGDCTQSQDVLTLDSASGREEAFFLSLEIDRGIYFSESDTAEAEASLSPESLYNGTQDNVATHPSFRKDVAAFVDVRSLFLDTAHNKDDLIYSCKWRGTTCPNDSFVEAITDFGICYTFNPGPAYGFSDYADQSGSRHGLQLTLNVEQYQHTHNGRTDAGVKVHLRNWDDLSNVRDVGIAAALSTHTLLSAKYEEAHSLPHPYGTCDAIPLPLYPNETYTYERCRAQNEALNLNDTCACRLYYMPDMDTDYCTTSEYLACVLRNWDNKAEMTDCPDACDQVLFSIQPSFSSLSSLGVNQLLSTNTSGLSQQYATSTELRHRFNPSLLLDTIALLHQVDTAIQDFMTYAEQVTSLSATSLYMLIQMSLDIFQDIVRDDVEAAFTNITNYRSAYRLVYSWKHATSVYVRTVLLPVLEKDEAAMAYETVKLQELLDQTLTGVLLAFSSMRFPITEPSVYVDTSNLSTLNNIPTTIFPSKHVEYKCSEEIHRYERDLAEFQEVNREFMGEVNLKELLDAIDSLDWADLQLRLDGFAKDHEMCTSFYSDFINGISELVNEVNQTAQQTLDAYFNFEQESEQVYLDHLWFTESVLEPYLDNKLTKSDMAAILTDDKISAIKVNVANIRSLIATKFSNVLEDNISGQMETSGNMYTTVLQVLAQLQVYFESTKLDCIQVARGMNIWRIPTSALYGNNLVPYKYEPEEVWHTWPSYMDIDSFLSLLADTTLDNINYDFYEELNKAIAEIDTTLDGLQDGITQALDNLGGDLNAHTAILEINEDFILNNFLTLDVYYGELIFQLVEQQASYQLDSFFSDLGGYMGLLLGGSAVTLAELLDLILYNLILKCSYTDRKRKQANKASKNGHAVLNNGRRPEGQNPISDIFRQMPPADIWAPDDSSSQSGLHSASPSGTRNRSASYDNWALSSPDLPPSNQMVPNDDSKSEAITATTRF